MRSTYSSLITQTQNYCLNDTSADTLTFIKNELNLAQRQIVPLLQNFTVHRVQSTLTVANQQFYHLPVDNLSIESVTVNIGGVLYNLKSVDSQSRWDWLNSIQFQAQSIPEWFFERKRDFGIWPTPQTASQVVTVTYNARLKDMTNLDYTTGTVTVTNGSQTITHSATGFTPSMVGQWFKFDTDGYWYRILSYVSSNTLTLETAFAGSTGSGAFTIGDSPDIPEDGHELLAYMAAEMYFSGPREDHSKAVFWGNMFWTGDGNNTSRDPDNCYGGVLSLVGRYAKRSENRIIRSKKKMEMGYANKIWGYHINP